MYVSSSMVFERADRVPDDRGAPAGLPDAAFGLRLLQAHGRGLLPRGARRARAAVHDLPPVQRLRAGRAARRRAGYRPRRARPDPQGARRPASAADLRLRRADAHAHPRRRHRRRHRDRDGLAGRPRTRTSTSPPREELTVAEIARIVWEACGNDPAAFELEHLPTFEVDVQRRWPSVEKARRAARLGGADRRATRASPQTVAWLRERDIAASRPPDRYARADMAATALITGITGQDGSYLAELLLEKGYEVHGMVRRASTEKFERIEHLRDRITLHQGDLLDQRSLVDALRAAEPGRDLQPRRDVVRRRLVDPADADRRVHRRRRDAHARGDARGLPRGALLPGVLQRDVRQGARGRRRPRRRRSTRARRTAWRRSTATSSRSTTASPTTCTRPAGSSSTTRARAAAWSSSPARSPGTRRRSSSAWRDKLRARQPRRRARLGLRQGLRRGDVADAPAATSRRTS